MSKNSYPCWRYRQDPATGEVDRRIIHNPEQEEAGWVNTPAVSAPQANGIVAAVCETCGKLGDKLKKAQEIFVRLNADHDDLKGEHAELLAKHEALLAAQQPAENETPKPAEDETPKAPEPDALAAKPLTPAQIKAQAKAAQAKAKE